MATGMVDSVRPTVRDEQRGAISAAAPPDATTRIAARAFIDHWIDRLHRQPVSPERRRERIDLE